MDANKIKETRIYWIQLFQKINLTSFRLSSQNGAQLEARPFLYHIDFIINQLENQVT